MFDSCLYRVRIAHLRSKPKRHHLKYEAFYLLLDLDELDRLHRRIKWFSVNSFNIFSFYDRDHGPGIDAPLRPWIDEHLRQAGIEQAGGKIKLLCMPRIFGYTFNPLAVYFCHDTQDRLQAILYEVSNTFGERHSYLFRVHADEDELIRHDCEKRFYVSPFMNVEGRYHFRVRVPGEKLFLHIHQTDNSGPILDAWVRGDRAALSNRSLLGAIARYPLLTVKVMAGIHWEAMKLWLKGVGIKDRPRPPDQAVSLINKPDK